MFCHVVVLLRIDNFYGLTDGVGDFSESFANGAPPSAARWKNNLLRHRNPPSQPQEDAFPPRHCKSCIFEDTFPLRQLDMLYSSEYSSEERAHVL